MPVTYVTFREFMDKVSEHYANKKWRNLIKILKHALTIVDKKIKKSKTKPGDESPSKKNKRVPPELIQEWDKFRANLSKFELQHDKIKNTFAFAFVEGMPISVFALAFNFGHLIGRALICSVGALVKAVQNGDWVLLDEINLASAETLEVPLTFRFVPVRSHVCAEP